MSQKEQRSLGDVDVKKASGWKEILGLLGVPCGVKNWLSRSRSILDCRGLNFHSRVAKFDA